MLLFSRFYLVLFPLTTFCGIEQEWDGTQRDDWQTNRSKMVSLNNRAVVTMPTVQLLSPRMDSRKAALVPALKCQDVNHVFPIGVGLVLGRLVILVC